MIEIHRQIPLISPEADSLKIKILGLGGAGSNALDRLLLDGLDDAEAVAVNTDAQALTASVATRKIQLGRTTTRGLGAGGDPELGLAAAAESAGEISGEFEGAGLVFLCVGLGGGTGSGAAPMIASHAREHGALVVAFATLPFTFEGRRRCQQAAEALETLRENADIVVCFENNRMGETVSPQAGIHQAFAASDTMISESVRAVRELFKRPGLMRIGFEDLARVLRGRHTRCLFGHGESDSDNRANEALTRALKSPLMDRGRLLDEAGAVLVNVVGGTNMTLNEVQILMEELNRHIGESTPLFFGTAVDPKFGNRMSVTIISSLDESEAPVVPQVHVKTKRVVAPKPRILKTPEPVRESEPVLEMPLAEEIAARVSEPEFAPEPLPEAAAEVFENAEPSANIVMIPEAVAELVEASSIAPVEEPEPEPVVMIPALRPRSSRHLHAMPEPQLPMDIPQVKAPQQESLPFEPVSRGRFEKSEPTIVDGQDLDVPTFMRRNVRIK